VADFEAYACANRAKPRAVYSAATHATPVSLGYDDNAAQWVNLKIADFAQRLRFVPEGIMAKRAGSPHDFTVVARRVVEQAIGEKLDGSRLDKPVPIGRVHPSNGSPYRGSRLIG